MVVIVLCYAFFGETVLQAIEECCLLSTLFQVSTEVFDLVPKLNKHIQYKDGGSAPMHYIFITS